MKQVFINIWRYSLFITVPSCILFFIWASGVGKNYYRYYIKQQYNKPVIDSLHQVGVINFNLEKQNFLSKLTAQTFLKRNKKTTLKKIRLFISETSLAKLDSNLPYSGKKYVDAVIWNNDKLEQVKVKYRGLHAYHWAFKKKSIKIKTKKKSLYGGAREFSLIVPKEYEQINAYASYQLAEKMGLVVPKTEMVEVEINGESRGLSLLVEDIEEIVLRNQHLMPGDIYKGEIINKDRYVGVNGKLFSHPSLWEKSAINNHYREDSRKPLEKLISLISESQSEDAQKKLSQLLDLEAWGRFSAFETLAQSVHYDNSHNWRLYFDPARSVFIPIVNDPLGFVFDEVLPNKEIIRSLLHVALFRNGEFLRARDTALNNFFIRGLDKEILRELDLIVQKTIPVILEDPSIIVSQLPVKTSHVATYSPLEYFNADLPVWPKIPFRTASSKEIADAAGKFPNKVEKVFNHVKLHYFDSDNFVRYGAVKNNGFLPLEISANKSVSKLKIVFLSPPKIKSPTIIRYMDEFTWVNVDISDSVQVNGNELDISTALSPDFLLKLKGTGLEVAEYRPAYYELFIGIENADIEMLKVLIDWGDGEFVSAKFSPRVKKHTFNTLKNVVQKSPATDGVIWKDEIIIEGNRQINGDVIIRPGTILRLAPEANLVLTGRLLIQGTEEKPVRFLPLHEGQEPWGVIALKGKAANGSELHHVIFKGGSGFKGDLFEYSGMLSIHDVKDVLLEDCHFMDNNLVDDMVHIVYADATFRRCVFERSLMDALDIDISTARVENCHFIDSGNDALDLMDSQVTVTDTILEKSGDKGISVGEGSRLLAINDQIKGNEIGIQVKDGSTAALYNLDFVGNKLALDAYKKNWRYGSGGKVLVDKSHFKRNEKMVAADKNSRLYVYDSYMNSFPEGHKKRIVFDSSVDTKNERQAAAATIQTSLLGKDMTEGFTPEFLDKIAPQTRGASRFGQH